MCILTYICNYLFLFHTLFYYKNGDWVFLLMEVLLYQACENGLTLGQVLQVCCSVVQSYLSNCCQNCATKTWSVYNEMWIICYPMLLLAKQYYRMKLYKSFYVNINREIYMSIFSAHLSKTNFAIASSIPWTGFIQLAWLSALNSCTRFSNLLAWKYHNHALQAKQRHCEEDRDHGSNRFSIKPAKISMPSKRRLRNKNTLSGMIFSTCSWFLPCNGSALTYQVSSSDQP